MVRIYTFVGLCAGTYVGVKALDNLVVWMADRREANAENFKIDREASRLKQQLLKEIKEKQATTDKVLKKHDTHVDKQLKKQWDEYNLVSKHQEEKLHKLVDKHFKEQDDHKLTNKYEEEVRQNLPEKPPKKQGHSKPPNKDHQDRPPILADKPLKKLGYPKFPKKDNEDTRQHLPDKPLNTQDDTKLLVKEKRQNLADTNLMKEVDRNLTSISLEDCPGEVVAECLECGEVFEIVEPVPHKDDSKSVSKIPENCPGEVVVECLECETTFEIVEPVPHSPERRADE